MSGLSSARKRGTAQTALALLLDRILREQVGDGLVDSIGNLRAAGRSYREIADWITDVTGTAISHEAVRLIHRHERAA